MNITKIASYVAIAIVGVPTVAFGGTFATSLVGGKTPSEAVTAVADQLGMLTGRVDQLESAQESTQTEIDSLKQENADLKAKQDTDVTAGAAVTASVPDCTATQAAVASLQQQEDAERAPISAQIAALNKQKDDLTKTPTVAPTIDSLQSGEVSQQLTAIANQKKAIQLQIAPLQIQLESIETTYSGRFSDLSKNAPEGCLKG